jgi:mono/diheme cytochrome c family protein
MRLLAAIGLLAILVAVGAGAFFLGGFYSIAATQPDAGPVAWVLVHTRNASISRHAADAPPAGFGTPAMVEDGARVFAAHGCVNCHGGPGVDWAKFSEGMQPSPADLKEIAAMRSAPQIFWVVKNGINMTGMPAFGPTGVPDKDIWALAAFIKKLPDIKDADYKAWTTRPGG